VQRGTTNDGHCGKSTHVEEDIKVALHNLKCIFQKLLGNTPRDKVSLWLMDRYPVTWCEYNYNIMYL
jgi:hypothetical protein